MLRRWLPLAVSIGLLLAVGAVGLQMNRSAVRTAETIHRDDTAELVRNNAMLGSQYLMLSARELADYATEHQFSLRPGDAGDRRLLEGLREKAVFFRYGVALSDLAGRQLNADTTGPLPPATDAGYEPVRSALLAGGPGFSSVLLVGGVPVTAVAVPVLVGGVPRGVLVGYTKVAESNLQAYLSQLGGPGDTGAILDGQGRFAAVSDPGRLGRLAEPEVRAALAGAQPMQPVVVEYRSGDRDMIGFLVTGMAGGWVSYSTRETAVFSGPLRDRSRDVNLALLAMTLVAGTGLTMMNHRARTVRRRTEERFRALVQNATDIITVLDDTGHIQYESPSVTRVLGFAPGARLGHLGVVAMHADDQDRARSVFADVSAKPGRVRRMECRLRHADGSYHWADVNVTNLLEHEAIGGVVVNARDISESRELQEKVTHQALHDALTGLPNRRLFHERLGAALGRSGQPGHLVVLVFVDLDRFKPVNDELGHEAGDELLRQVAARLTGCVRPGDTVARLGGDEFVILVDRVDGAADAVGLANRVVDCAGAPFEVAGRRVGIGASVGVTLAHPGQDQDAVLGRADAAMYQAKQAGGRCFELHDGGPFLA